MEDSRSLAQAVRGQKMPIYVRLKRRRDEPPPAFLCVLPPQKRQHLPDGTSGRSGVLERALIFKHVDSAPPPVTSDISPRVFPSQRLPDEVLQPHVSTERREVGIVHSAEKCCTEETPNGNDQKSHVSVEETSPTVESTTFWSAFNTPLRSDVFGPFAGTEKAAPARLGYQDAVEEAVKSLRRFRVDSHQQRGDLVSTQRKDVLLHERNPVTMLDVCQDAAADSSGANQEREEFEYDLYEIECDSGDKYPWEADVGVDSHKQRLLELLEQDRSAVALVEVEDVDDTGIITNRNGSMQVFLEEFGDIDDSDSDEGGEIDYPSGESSDDQGRRSARCTWDSESSGSDRSKSGEESFDDDCF